MQVEHNITKTDYREVSRKAMRELFLIAQKKVETGGQGALPYDKIQDAKEFYRKWYKDLGMGFREHSFLMFVPIFTAYFTNDLFLIIVAFIASWGLKLFFAASRTRKVYIAEMLGDTRFQDETEREFYKKGLLIELYGFEDVKVRYFFTLVTFFIALSSLLLSAYFEHYSDVLVAVSTVTTIAFFASKLTIEKKYKKENA